LANLGLVTAAGHAHGDRQVAVTYNASARYQCRWIDLKVQSNSPWLQGVENMHIPVAHGEGRFMMDDSTLKTLQDNNQIAAAYVQPNGQPANGKFPYNPNGATADIAAITDETAKVLAMMPHPERGMFTWQRDDYMELKDKAQREGETLPEETDGISLFQNAARYFEVEQKKLA
jgi:phosphoribosylformylglycinamidine (FGAM) synthase-like amidotransferase family enzyme